MHVYPHTPRLCFLMVQAIERMRGEVAEEYPDKTINVEFMSLDLASLQSVKKFIEDYKQKERSLHLLINNAGLGIIGQSGVRKSICMHVCMPGLYLFTCVYSYLCVHVCVYTFENISI